MANLPKSQNPVVKFYLFVYNAILFSGWLYVAFRCDVLFNRSFDGPGTLIEELPKAVAPTFSELGSVVSLLETIALLEIFNAAVGIVRGTPLNSLLLHGGRFAVLYLAVYDFPEIQTHWAVWAMFLVFAIGEVIRYAMYVVQVAGSEAPYLLTFLRYSTPLLLFPIGCTMECLLLFQAAEDHKAAGRVYQGVPSNALVFFYGILAYGLGAPFLMFNMLKAFNSKILKRKKSEKKE